MREDQNYPTIRQCARRGPLSEHTLRLMQKRGELPGFFCGNHYRVNYPALLDRLKAESMKTEART